MKIIESTKDSNPRVMNYSEVPVGTVFRWYQGKDHYSGPVYIKTEPGLADPNGLFDLSHNRPCRQHNDHPVYTYPNATLHLED